MHYTASQAMVSCTGRTKREMEERISNKKQRLTATADAAEAIEADL